MEKKNKGILIGASIGVLAGTIAGILLAPKSGEKTRNDIANYIHEMKDKIANELTEANDLTKKTYNAIVDKIVKVYELGKKITTQDADDIRGKLDSNYDRVIETIKAKKKIEIKKAAKK